MKRRIEVVEYDPRWKEMFRAEAGIIALVFRQRLVAVHHIGSTAIPACSAKPVIDILVEVHDIGTVDELNADLRSVGYLPMGEYGIPGRRFFIKGGDIVRTHHLHVFTAGDRNADRHIDFRDYLIDHPDEAKAYSALKLSLAREHRYDIDGYMAGKDGFILDIIRQAEEWREQNRHF